MGGPGTGRDDAVACGTPPDDGRIVAYPAGEPFSGPFGDAEPLAEKPTDAAGVEACDESRTITSPPGSESCPFFVFAH